MRVGASLALGLCALALLPACDVGSDQRRVTLTVQASADLTDLRPLFDDLEKATGVRLDVDYGADGPAPGAYRHDLAWPSSDRLFRLRARAAGVRELPTSTAIMTSPVVVGLRPATADALRAGRSELTWADLADGAAQGRVRFAMADPRTGGSGLSALVGVATAAAGTGGVLRPADVTCDRLRGFFTGQTRAAADTAALADDFTAHQDDLDGLVAHESTLLSLNAGGGLRQPLEIVYPRDGTVLSDYPLLLLDPAHRDAYDRVVAWLRSPDVQARISRDTHRRPLDPGVRRDPALATPIGNALFYPDDARVIDTLLAAYRPPAQRRPDRIVFVLDYSRSMRGAPINAVRAAFTGLGGDDDSTSGRFVRFHRGERITVIRFGRTVLDERVFTAGTPGDMRRLRDYLTAGRFDGATAIWSALDRAYALAATGDARTSIVLMTDGRNNAGLSAAGFLRRHRDPAVPTFALGFGDADHAGLRRVAEATGGSAVAVGALTALPEALKEIRGCL